MTEPAQNLNPKKPEIADGSHSFATPDGRYEIRVDCYAPSNTDNIYAYLSIRDLSVIAPPFNAATHLEDLDYNVIHWAHVKADRKPEP